MSYEAPYAGLKVIDAHRCAVEREHGLAILTEHRYSSTEIEALIQAGVLVAG